MQTTDRPNPSPRVCHKPKDTDIFFLELEIRRDKEREKEMGRNCPTTAMERELIECIVRAGIRSCGKNDLRVPSVNHRP